MSIAKKPLKIVQKLIQQIWKLSMAITKKLMSFLLRGLFILGRRSPRFSNAGFVLPTVVMVLLVVVLLTTAIVFRSFDRSRNISNYRVNQEVLNAAMPALDRAKAKIEALFADPKLPRGTPSDISINNVLTNPKYNLLDETRLRMAYDFGNGQGVAGSDGTIQSLDDENANAIQNEEINKNAWRFPVDSDNNGLNDSFTLYGISFRIPNTIDSAGNSARERVPLEARALPMSNGATSPNCATALGTSASLVGASGWYKTGGQLKRSFFIYVTTVPITNKAALNLDDPDQYEDYKGNKGFSALEYQQDRAKVPLSNNAILYEDDVDISSGGDFALNGRIFTNSNLFVTDINDTDITLRQVSSRNSCFYEAENSKIVVGGNVSYGRVTGGTTSGSIDIDLYKGTRAVGDPATEAIDTSNQSVTQGTPAIAYNTQAYEARIKELVRAAVALGSQSVSGTAPNVTVTSGDPADVRDAIAERIETSNTDPDEARKIELETYFRERTRRVPFTEVAFGEANEEDFTANPVTLSGSGDTLGPPEEWMYPFAPSDGKTETGYGLLTLNTNGDKLLPPATRFDEQESNDEESYVGDRVLIGNNLPAYWLKGNKWVGQDEEQNIEGTNWDNPEEGPRTRKTRVEVLSDLGDISRDGFWEIQAATMPKTKLDGTGGLRIVTGAGIYLPRYNSIAAATASKVVWPDTMPVIPPDVDDLPSWLPGSPPAFPIDKQNKTRPILKMRASAVYDYKYQDGKKPIACVSNYYDPTNAQTVKNRIDTSGVPTTDVGAESINGITYGPPNATEASVIDHLTYQSELFYPNGRLVNEQLKKALARPAADRTNAEQAAIDSTICALQIYGKTMRTGEDATWGDIGAPTTTPTAGYTLPHDTIKEVAFLDGRQVKALNGELDDEDEDPVTHQTTDYTNLSQTYDLALEQRQPLEIRATQLDLYQLRTSTAGNLVTTTETTSIQEHLLPLSGIIYATRDDALVDNTESGEPKISASDFKLDPTRRPNGIMLINGARLERTRAFVEEEKGLILASNLPVYIKAQPPNSTTQGGFNLHQDSSGVAQEEFTDSPGFYERENANPFFACREDDPRLPTCTTSDTWRPATILSDAVTLLSRTFREGNRAEGDYDLRNNQIDTVVKDVDGDENPDLEVDVDGDGNVDLDAAFVKERLRLRNGFWNNDFVTNGLSSSITVRDPDNDGVDNPKTPTDADYSDSTTPSTTYVGSSYFNNFVTPVQRRAEFPEYVMEICRKLPVSECTANDWVIGYDLDGDGDLTGTEVNIKHSELLQTLNSSSPPIFPFSDTDSNFDPALLGAGTTARRTRNLDDMRYARRVAFLRYPANVGVGGDGELKDLAPDQPVNGLVLYRKTGAPRWTPVPLGVAGPAQLSYYPYFINLTINGTEYPFYNGSDATPQVSPNSLWYRGTDDADNKYYGPGYPLDYVNGLYNDSDGFAYTPPLGDANSRADEQPLLAPVLQLHVTQGAPGPAFPGTPTVGSTRWIQQAAGDTIFNLVMATGDNPSRPASGDDGEYNGGVPNLPRFLENWVNDASANTRFLSKISGSLIQLKRSSYATAPFQQVPTSFVSSYPTDLSLGGGPFGYTQVYNTGNSAGRTPAYEAPGRDWGFDVGLLSQLPDLFSNQFTLPPTEKPNEFFREVSREDDWVRTLLCAKTLDPTDPNYETVDGNAINDDQRPSGFCDDYTGG